MYTLSDSSALLISILSDDVSARTNLVHPSSGSVIGLKNVLKYAILNILLFIILSAGILMTSPLRWNSHVDMSLGTIPLYITSLSIASNNFLYCLLSSSSSPPVGSAELLDQAGFSPRILRNVAASFFSCLSIIRCCSSVG